LKKLRFLAKFIKIGFGMYGGNLRAHPLFDGSLDLEAGEAEASLLCK